MPDTLAVARGCGDTREEGALYLEVGLSAFGKPFDSFLLDPVVPLHPDDLLAIPRLGVTLIEGADGIVHVIDWIGETHYPFATDFLEEGRRKGFSRKISKLVEVNRLTPGKSMIYFLHARGYLENYRLFAAAEYEGEPNRNCRWYRRESPFCQTVTDGHCRRHLYAAVPVSGGSKNEVDGPYTQLWRHFVDFDYQIYPPKVEIPPVWKPAYVARFPITNLAVVKARDESHIDTLASARNRSRYEVKEVDA